MMTLLVGGMLGLVGGMPGLVGGMSELVLRSFRARRNNQKQSSALSR